MTDKTVTLASPALDNLNQYHDAGSELRVGDDAKAGFIHPDRLKDRVGDEVTAAKASGSAKD
jgi:hypothetical protein